MNLGKFYIEVTPEESVIVQQLLYRCGYRWSINDGYPLEDCEPIYLNVPIIMSLFTGRIYHNNLPPISSDIRELSLEELISEIEEKL